MYLTPGSQEGPEWGGALHGRRACVAAAPILLDCAFWCKWDEVALTGFNTVQTEQNLGCVIDRDAKENQGRTPRKECFHACVPE